MMCGVARGLVVNPSQEGYPRRSPLVGDRAYSMHHVEGKISVLVVDDEAGAREPLCEFLSDEGYEVRSASDGAEGFVEAKLGSPDIILTDLRMPTVDGLTLIENVRAEASLNCAIVVMTAFGSVETAVEALKRGADDYLVKPIHLGQLLVVLDRLCRQRRLRKELHAVQAQTFGEGRGEGGDTSTDLELVSTVLRESIETLAPLQTNVLIYGEVGTGKVPVARAIHQASGSSTSPRILNCAVHGERNAYEFLFGGVDNDGGGWLTQVDTTLILADVEHLTGVVQEKLYESLSESADGARRHCARVISTTALDMQEEMDSGRFLPSLGRLLSSVRVRVPTLRERHAELIPVLQTALFEAATRYQLPVPQISEEALEILVGYAWPGNLRELRQTVERAVLVCEGGDVEPSHFPEALQSGSVNRRMPPVPGASLRELERYALLQTLEQVGGSTTKAATILGISPRKIQYRLNEYREEDLSERGGNMPKPANDS
jgi:DNA-binding NtrC family response regulator